MKVGELDILPLIGLEIACNFTNNELIYSIDPFIS